MVPDAAAEAIRGRTSCTFFVLLLGVVFFGSRDLRTVRRVALEVERVIDIAASLDFG